MPVNILKYGIALFAFAIISYFCARVIFTKLRQAGYIKKLNFGKKKENEEDNYIDIHN